MLTRVLTIVLLSAATQPASRPATQPSGDVELRAIVTELQQQVSALKQENAALKRQALDGKRDAGKGLAAAIAEWRKRRWTDPDIGDLISVGMTDTEAMETLGREPQRVETEGASKTMRWDFDSGGPTGSLYVTTRDGKVTRVRKVKTP